MQTLDSKFKRRMWLLKIYKENGGAIYRPLIQKKSKFPNKLSHLWSPKFVMTWWGFFVPQVAAAKVTFFIELAEVAKLVCVEVE